MRHNIHDIINARAAMGFGAASINTRSTRIGCNAAIIAALRGSRDYIVDDVVTPDGRRVAIYDSHYCGPMYLSAANGRGWYRPNYGWVRYY